MNDSDVKQYVGKVVTVDYGKHDEAKGSVRGEVLAVDRGVLCLGLNVADQSAEIFKIIPLDEVVVVEEASNSEHASENFLTIGNYHRYCSHLLRGIELKSKAASVDFYAASEEYLLALESGFISDEMMTLYLETVTNYLGFIKMDRYVHDEEFYKKELENRVECFIKVRSFLNSDDISFKSLSDHALNKILSYLYNYKSSAYGEKIVKTVYERYPKEYLISDLDKLLALPKIAYSLLLFAVQIEAMGYLGKGMHDKKSELDAMIAQCRTLCQEKLESYQEQAEESEAEDSDLNQDLLIVCDQLTEMIKKIDDCQSKVNDYEDKVSKDDARLNPNSLKPLIFRFTFDKLIYELNKTQESLGSNEKTPENLNRPLIKSRYDMYMAQFFNLLRYISVYEKDAEDELESKWQIALQLMDIYFRKLQLIPSPNSQEYLEVKSKYKKDIKERILSALAKDAENLHYDNYFKACKRTKLVRLADLLYEYELWEDFILISPVLLDDSVLGKKNKTHEEYKMLCYFRQASIYSMEGELNSKVKFNDSFAKAVTIYNILRYSNSNDRQKRILESCRVFYADLYPIYRPEFGAIINLKNKLNELKKKVVANCLNMSKLMSFKEEFDKLLKEGINILRSDYLQEYEDENDSEIFSLIYELLAYLDNNDFAIAKRLNEQISDERFSFDLSKLSLRKENIISNINSRISEVKRALLRSWPDVIYEFKKNRNHENEYNATRVTNDFFAKFDMMAPLAPESIVSILLEVFGKQDQRTVTNFIRRNISLLLEKAELLGIEHNGDFHKMLWSRCEDVPPKMGIVLAKCLYFLARYPAGESIDERIEFCKKGMRNCNKYIKSNQISKDWANLQSLLNKLQMEKEIKTLAGLQKAHTPQITVDFLSEQFGSAEKLKYLTHADNGISDLRRYSHQLQGMGATFEEGIRNCKSNGVTFPLPVENGIRSFINGSMLLDEYMYRDYEERRPVGWGTALWSEWLKSHSSVKNPLNVGIDFPYRDDVNRFRSLYRIERNQQIADMIAAVAPDVTHRIGEEARSRFHYYGWLPQVAAAVELMVADIRQIKADAEIEAVIDLKSGTLTIIHVGSDPEESAESFYAKLSKGGGAIFEIAKGCLGVCDYHVVANWSRGTRLQRVNILNDSQKGIEDVNEELSPRGFRHVLTFYKPTAK